MCVCLRVRVSLVGIPAEYGWTGSEKGGSRKEERKKKSQHRIRDVSPATQSRRPHTLRPRTSLRRGHYTSRAVIEVDSLGTRTGIGIEGVRRHRVHYDIYLKLPQTPTRQEPPMATNASDPPSPPSPPTIRGHEGGDLSISMNNGSANIPRSALSPVSVAGSDWSGIKNYNSPENDLMFGGPPGGANQMNGRHNVSPPASVARSSDGTGLYASSEGSATLRNIALEEQVALHHTALAKWLRDFLRTKGNIRPNRARDKLLRLSAIQFQELSTDVYDELQRREPGATDDETPEDEAPPFLPPKQNFHEKRNQARQKLSTLPADRFRDLATDVFYELERRFPRFSSGLIPPITSPTNSMDGRGMPPMGGRGSNPGMPPRMASPGPMRAGSPGPGMMRPGGPYRPGPGGPPGTAAGANGYRGPPRGPPPHGAPPGPPRGPVGPDGQNSFGRPLPKTFQNSTIIPNKGTMIEDDDGDDDDDMDAFGLEDNGQRRSGGPGRRGSARSIASRASHDVGWRHPSREGMRTDVERAGGQENHRRVSGQGRDPTRQGCGARGDLGGEGGRVESFQNVGRLEGSECSLTPPPPPLHVACSAADVPVS